MHAGHIGHGYEPMVVEFLDILYKGLAECCLGIDEYGTASSGVFEV